MAKDKAKGKAKDKAKDKGEDKTGGSGRGGASPALPEGAEPEGTGKKGKGKGRGGGKTAKGSRPGLLDRLTTLVVVLFLASWVVSQVAHP